MAENENGTQQVAHTGNADAEPTGFTETEARPLEMPQQKRGKRGWIVAGIIVAVVVVAGIGMWVWHEQPSFCNAFCHSPMDTYVETYESGDAGMASAVHAQAGETCLSCHEAVLTTQVSELMTWVSDSYPMTEDGTMLATGKEFATQEFCTSGGCHDMSEVVANTWGFEGNDEKYNPHSSHQDNQLECGDCHKAHETSTLYCAKCHDLTLPEGWEATNE